MTFLLVAAPLLLALSLVHNLARRGSLRRSFALYRALRPRHYALGLPALLLVIATYALLSQVPGLSWGWWSAIGGRGENANFGGGAEIGTSALAAMVVPALMLVLLALGLPLLAELEERLDGVGRLGHQHRGVVRIVLSSLGFGLMHMVVGVSFALALSLFVAGLAFSGVYLRTYRSHVRARVSPEGSSQFIELTRRQIPVTTVTVGTESSVGPTLTPQGVEVLPQLDEEIQAFYRASLVDQGAQHFAVRESTLVHLAYNTVVLTFAALALALVTMASFLL